MIKTFKHKGLAELFERGTSSRVDSKLQARCIERLDVLNRASDIRALNLQGYRLHQLKQHKPVRFSIWVSGAWRITFVYEKGDAYSVDLEQYH